MKVRNRWNIMNGLRKTKNENNYKKMEEDDKTEYQITMNGNVKAFPTLEKLLEYVLKNKDELYYCSIRKVVGRGSCGFVINRM